MLRWQELIEKWKKEDLLDVDDDPFNPDDKPDWDEEDPFDPYNEEPIDLFGVQWE